MKGTTPSTTAVHMQGEITPLVAAAHELKSPLTLIHYLAQSLRDKDFPFAPSQQAAYLERIELTSKRMLRLVHQFALSYRLENEQQLGFAFQLEPLSTVEVCEEALHEMTPYATAQGLTLQLRQGHCPHLVLAQRDVLHDIITNLVDNALRHSSGGTAVMVTPSCRGGAVRLAVQDNGQPVARHEMRALNKTIGHQLQPLSGRSGTSGLGLYIVQQLARAMGGSLGASSASQGAVFFVDLIRSRQLSLL